MLSIRILPALICIFSFLPLTAQLRSDTIPLPENTISGSLPSGFRYMVMPNQVGNKTIEFAMVVNIGSIVETPVERGMAHFLEHMAFNGSQNFPGDSIIQTLREMGLKFGKDLNAFTGYDKTVYYLTVPNDYPENIDTALDIIYEWACQLQLKSEEIEKEKGVVYQEIKDFVSFDDFAEFKLEESPYYNCRAIGDHEQVKSINHNNLKAFYDKWYRPDLISVIAVGDLDASAMEQKITQRFSKLQNRSSAPARTSHSLAIKGKTACKAIIDSSIWTNKVELIFPVKDHTIQTYDDLKNSLTRKIFTRLLDERLNSSKISSDFIYQWYLSDAGHYVFSYSNKSLKKILKAITHSGQQLANIKKYGFTQAELEAAKADIMERLTDGNDNYSSLFWRNTFQDMLVTGGRFISNQIKQEVYPAILEKIDINSFNKELSFFFDQTQKVMICANLTEAIDEKALTADIKQSWKQGINRNTKAYRYKAPKEIKKGNTTPQASLKAEVSKGGEVVSQNYFDQLDITELKLSNGLRVALKPLKTDEKEIRISAFARGGLSLTTKEDYRMLASTAAYVDMGGLGSYSSEEISELGYEMNLTTATTISDYMHHLYGSSFEGDLENLLKLFYLKITSSTPNYKDFKESIASEAESYTEVSPLLLQLQNSPGRIHQEHVARFCGDIVSDRPTEPSKDELLNMDLDKMHAFFNRLFQNSEELTILITGKFEAEKAIPLVEHYLGALPANTEISRPVFMGAEFPKGLQRDTIADLENERPQMTYLLHGEHQHCLKNSMILLIMRDAIQNRLLSQLREEKGLVYSPYANLTRTAYPRTAYCFQIDYLCDKENQALLENLLFQELNDLKKNGISELEIKKIVQSFLITKRSVLNNDNVSGWHSKIQEIYLEDGSLDDFNNYETIAKSITTQDVKAAFVKYIDKNACTVVSIDKPKR